MIAASAEASDGAQPSSWLTGTRKVYHDELTRDVRLLTLLRVAFFSPGKQAALGSLSSYMATLLTAISRLPGPSATAVEPAIAAAASASSSEARSGHANIAAVDESKLSNLLRYVPVVYVDVVVDFLTALRKSDEALRGVSSEQLRYICWPAGWMQPQGANNYVTWLATLLNDPRIANPDVQESLLQVAGLLLERPSGRGLFEARPPLAKQLMAALLVVFDSRLWHPASGVLLKIIKDCGFSRPTLQPLPPHSLQKVLLDLLDAPAGAPQGATEAVRTKGFLNRLFNTLNWTLTEFTVAVGELHTLRGRRSILEAQNQYRRTGLMFELSVNFMRILEFAVPTTAFLSSPVNRTRLRELLQFVLSHFTTGPDSRRLNELLHASQPAAATLTAGSSGNTASAAGATAAAAEGGSTAAAGPLTTAAAAAGWGEAGAAGSSGRARRSTEGRAAAASAIPAYAASAMRFESNSLSERVQKPALLAPVMGILLALWEAHKAAGAENAAAIAAQEALKSRHGYDASVSVAAALSSSAAASAPAKPGPFGLSDDEIIQELAEVADDRFMAALKFLQGFDWSAAFPSLPLSGPIRAFGQLLEALQEARAAHDEAADADVMQAEIPDDFLDPITMDIMQDPVKLPDSQVFVDRNTIERHLLSSSTDPFSRAPLTPEQLVSDNELKERIQQWFSEHRRRQ
eukprot:GHRR01003305.1.p1 GENE.GHRR01003305.1~~GHRR01003305.1.p1  ORF type:complete len:773 (+),score=310.18 GHRR01003305.1:253-2319(+)